MLFDETRPVKKPYSIWELRQVLDCIDERRKKLIWHRSEVAGASIAGAMKKPRRNTTSSVSREGRFSVSLPHPSRHG